MALALSLTLAGAAVAQNAPANKTLVVNGRTADAAVVQIDGHSYVEVDTFARMINAASGGSLGDSKSTHSCATQFAAPSE